MSRKHVMIDIETLGTKPGCAILAIAAVEFDPFGVNYGAEFYQNVELTSQIMFGAEVNAATLEWWQTQSEQAKLALVDDQVRLEKALSSFAFFIERFDGEKCPMIWAKSVQFDTGILAHAMNEHGVVVPWTHRDLIDCRTVMELAKLKPVTMPMAPPSVPPAGVPHNALFDCRYQIMHTQEAIRKLGNG